MLRRIALLVSAPVFVAAIAWHPRMAEGKSPEDTSGKVKLTFRERQEVHKQLWADYGAIGTIYDLLSETTGDLVIRRTHVPGFTGGPENPPPYPPYPLIAMSCTSDAAIVGRAGDATSGLMQGDAFLYSDVEFRVEEVIKDNEKAAIQPDSTIIVTRPGGTITIQGRTVRAVDPNFRDFRRGRHYLLYLRYEPRTGAYKASGEDGFELLDNKVRDLAESPFWLDLDDNDPATLLSAARDAAAHGCSKGDRE